MQTRYPFRFYGARPGDWAEGANMGHEYHVKLSRVPSAAERVRLVELWDGATRKGPIDPSPWEWSGPFARVVFGERLDVGDAEDVFAQITDILKAVHALVPIVDVTYTNAHDASDDWSRWSLEQGPPDPGPRTDLAVWCEEIARSVEPRLPPFGPDAAMEDAARQKERARILEALATAKGGLSVRPVERPVDAGLRYDPSPLMALQEPHCPVRPVDNPSRPIASLRDRSLVWVDDEGQVQQWDGIDSIPYLPGPIAVGPGGNDVLIAKKKVAWHLDLQTREGFVFALRESEYDYLSSVAYCDGGFWAVLSEKRLRLFAPGPAPEVTISRRIQKLYASEVARVEGAVEWGEPIATLPPVASMRLSGASWLHSVCNGALLIVQHSPGITFIATSGGKLRRLAKLDVPLYFLCERDGQVYLRLARQVGEDLPELSKQYVVHGIAEALARKGKPRRKK